MNLSENAVAIMNILRDNDTADITAKDLADMLNISAASANGTITGLQKKGLVVREVVEEVDGKVIRLTDSGLDVDLA